MLPLIATQDTQRAEQPSHHDVTHIRPVVRCRPSDDVRRALDRRLSIAREFIEAHRAGRGPETLAQLDAAYLATRFPLDCGESYEG